MVLGLYSPKGSYDAVFLGNYADINLVDAIKRVSGVGDVKNFTAQDYSMRIWLEPNKMAALGITPEDVAAAVREQNAQAPAGRSWRRARPRRTGKPIQRAHAWSVDQSATVCGDYRALQFRRLSS